MWMGCLRGSPTTPTSSKTSTGRRRLAPPLTTGASGNKVGRISTICFDSKSGTSLPISHLMVCKMVCKRLLARESSRPPHDQHALSPAKTLCRAGGIRTHDPLTPSQVRYQAALQPATSDAYVIASPLAPFALGPDPHVNANRAALESELLAEPPLDESAVTCL